VSVRKIVVLGTGGTISGRAASAQDNVGYVAGQVTASDLVAGVAVPAGVQLEVEQVAQIDSKDIDFEVWRALAQRCSHWLAQDDVCGIVITHGTDTMEETAYFLHRVLQARKPVLLTGAMRPASSDEPDGPANLRDALAVAASPVQGVGVVFAGQVHSSVDVYKEHSHRVDAFSSGDAGPVARLEQERLRLLREWPAPCGEGVPQGEWPRVEIVLNCAGASGAIVEALVAQQVRGIVAAGTGNGTLHRELETALLRAQAAGVRVVRASRCAQGGVVGHARDTLAHAGQLSPVKARIALMLQLMRPAPAARAG
jgi:L-asparaginase